ncbi:MAG: hypothetical protein WBQ72_05995 [Terriglobales bacterium]|jgi:hypothetical protein
MPEETKHGANCTEFEALLTEAIEGRLTGAQKESFEAHRRTCGICGPLFAEVQAGREWLRSLEAVEPPTFLVHNILAATSGVVSTRVAAPGALGTTPRRERLREWWDSWFAPLNAFVRQPRFVMSFGMIFFSGSLALSAAGVKASDVAKVSLRPSSIRHAYTDAQIKVVKYYDNVRFVYEIESKVRELKRAATPAEPAPQEEKQNHKNDTSGQPQERQDRNYSREQGDTVLAGLNGSEVIPVRPVASDAGTADLRIQGCSQPAARGSRVVSNNRRFV